MSQSDLKKFKTQIDITVLRGYLAGVKWDRFRQHPNLSFNRVQFYGRFGLHMGRPVVAILANGQFVAVHLLDAIQPDINQPDINLPVLDPTNLYLGLRTNRLWNYPSQLLLWEKEIVGPDNE